MESNHERRFDQRNIDQNLLSIHVNNQFWNWSVSDKGGGPQYKWDAYVWLKCNLCYCFTAKSQELKKDIEILSQTFERVIDRKEAIIKSLVKDIEEAEEQYQMALRSHLQNVVGLIGTYYSLFSDI